MRKIVTILGARPQFIKAAAVSRIAKDYPIQEIIVHTGQHFDANMSDVFFEQMEIPKPDYRLEINSLTHGAMTGRMLEEIEKVLLKEKPEIVMVYGDTNTTLAGALAAKKLSMNVAHIEAGLRSFNMTMPEEINRIITDRISNHLFCPTENAVKNLKTEGFDNFNSQVHLVGDVMYDAALHYEKLSDQKSTILRQLNLTGKEFILCTVHRQENTDNQEQLASIVGALNKIHKFTQVILPLHPRTKKTIQNLGLKPEFKPIDPVGYFDILQLIKHSALVITDSGGMQKEACFFGKFCITLRDETEWIELVENNVNFLSGADKNKILQYYNTLFEKSFPVTGKLYGDGKASEKILRALK